MILTLTDIIYIFIFCGVISAALLGMHYSKNKDLKKSIKFGIKCLSIITTLVVFGVILYNTNTQTGQRKLKEWKSEIDGGLYREIIITSEEGREIFRYEGKIDIELNKNNNNNSNYILFESEEGLRYIIYYGVQDTVLVIEKPQQ